MKKIEFQARNLRPSKRRP